MPRRIYRPEPVYWVWFQVKNRIGISTRRSGYCELGIETMLRALSKRLSRSFVPNSQAKTEKAEKNGVNGNNEAPPEVPAKDQEPAKNAVAVKVLPKPIAEEIESLTKLAETVSASVATITEYLKRNNLPEPTLNANVQTYLPREDEVVAAREKLVQATSALEALTQFDSFGHLAPVMYAVC